MNYRALEDKSSPYYYGEDATYKAPASSREPSRKIQYELDENGLPVQSRTESTAERTARRQRVGLPVGERPGGNRIRVGGKEYAEGDPALQKVLDANRKKQPKMADIRGGGGLNPYRAPSEDPPYEPLTEDATVSKITNPSNPPRNAAEFGAFMETLTDKYKVQFPGEQERNGYQSIYLPGTDSNSAEYSASDDAVMGASSKDYLGRKGGGSMEIVIGGNMGAQSGTSDSADKGELKRVVKGVNGTEFGGEAEAPPTIFKDARTRAFLDYDGDKPMMAMRAAEAAQNTIKQNGVLYALDGEGKGTAIDKTTAREFKKDGNKMASQDFLRNYRYEPEGTTDMPIADITEAEDTGTFTRGLESNVIEDPSEKFRALGLM